MPEIRFEAKAKTLSVLDGFCSATEVNPTSSEGERK